MNRIWLWKWLHDLGTLAYREDASCPGRDEVMFCPNDMTEARLIGIYTALCWNKPIPPWHEIEHLGDDPDA